MDERTLRIRAAGPGDLERVLELWGVARTAHAVTPDTPQALGRLLARDPEALLVAEIEGRIVGALVAAFDGWRGGMYRLAVEPEWRRRGIGVTLIREGERRAREAGARRITALVATEDAEARAFWEAAGYDHDPNIARYVKNV